MTPSVSQSRRKNLILKILNPPEDQHIPWKLMVGRLFPFSKGDQKGWFSISMLIFWGVHDLISIELMCCHHAKWILSNPGSCLVMSKFFKRCFVFFQITTWRADERTKWVFGVARHLEEPVLCWGTTEGVERRGQRRLTRCGLRVEWSQWWQDWGWPGGLTWRKVGWKRVHFSVRSIWTDSTYRISRIFPRFFAFLGIWYYGHLIKKKHGDLPTISGGCGVFFLVQC